MEIEQEIARLRRADAICAGIQRRQGLEFRQPESRTDAGDSRSGRLEDSGASARTKISIAVPRRREIEARAERAKLRCLAKTSSTSFRSSAWFTTSRPLVYSSTSATAEFLWGETAWNPSRRRPSPANRRLCACIAGSLCKRASCRHRTVARSFPLPTGVHRRITSSSSSEIPAELGSRRRGRTICDTYEDFETRTSCTRDGYISQCLFSDRYSRWPLSPTSPLRHRR